MQRLGHQLFAAAGLPLDQNRKRCIGELRHLLAQFVDRRTLPDEAAVGGRTELRIADLERALEQVFERLRLGGLGHELDRTERARMPRVGFIALARQHDDFDAGGVGDQLADQAKPFVGAMRGGRQSQIDQRQLRGALQLPQQTLDLGALVGHIDREIPALDEIECIGDQRVVVDDQ